MSKLERNKKINPNYKQDYARLNSLIAYSDLCAGSLAIFQEAITKESGKNFTILKNDLAKHNITAEMIMNIYASLLLNQFLLMYAYLGNILVAVLKGVKVNGKKITGKESLGPLMGAIKDLTAVDLKDGIIDEKFRNALGHGWIWVSDNKLYYFTDGTLTTSSSLTIKQLFIRQRELWHFVANWGSFIYYSP